MNYILDGFIRAFQLIISLDSELYQVISLSVGVAFLSTLIISLICIPLGLKLGLKNFKGDVIFARVIFSLMGVPSVVVGLLIAILLSRNSLLGFLELLYTPTAIIIAQSFLIFPLCLSLTYTLSRSKARKINRVGKILGGNWIDRMFLILSELKEELLIIIITCFSRAITEVGAVMIVGGNLKGSTRVMTTSISMLNSMGDYSTGIAFGIILVIITFTINNFIYVHKVEGDL
ncbi:MAG: ABC transporter permease [Psychrilyobacter sp.]|nr:ABC transporter permease [Psychrilyobacter sp.]